MLISLVPEIPAGGRAEYLTLNEYPSGKLYVEYIPVASACRSEILLPATAFVLSYIIYSISSSILEYEETFTISPSDSPLSKIICSPSVAVKFEVDTSLTNILT